MKKTDNSPVYQIVESTDDVLCLKDISMGTCHMSITNGAEIVVESVKDILKGRRLEYIDTCGDRDQLLVGSDGKFAGFAPAKPPTFRILTKRAAMEADYPTFNTCEHMFVSVKTDKSATISVDFNGTRMTFAFISNGKDGVECCDIKVHHDEQKIQPNLGDMRTVPIQRAIMFRGGSHRTDVVGSLLTVLLSKEHLNRKED